MGRLFITHKLNELSVDEAMSDLIRDTSSGSVI